MSRTLSDPDETFKRIAKPSQKGKNSPKHDATLTATIAPKEEKPTAKLTISLTPSMKSKLDAMVFERKQAGEKTSASDIVRQLLIPMLGE